MKTKFLIINLMLLLVCTPMFASKKHYTGEWQSTSIGISGTFEVSYELEGAQIKGDISIQGSTITSGGEIEGTLEGNKIKFGFMASMGVRIEYSGTIEGETIKGTYKTTSSALNDEGIWNGKETKENQE